MPLRHLLLLFFVAISICNAGGLSAQPLATPDSAIASDAYSASLLLSRYIRFASVTGHEREAGEWLSGFCEVQGLAIQRFSREEGSYAFAASLYPLATDKPNVVLESHIDVVDAGDPSRWVHPPFAGLIVNDTLWGRGAIDDKAQTVMQLEALLRFLPEARAHDLPFNVTLLCVGGEETTSAGARLVASKFWDKLNAVVVIGEGGSGVSNLPVSDKTKKIFAVSVAEKSYLGLQVNLQITSGGHGSVPPARYANKEMITALGKLAQRTRSLTFTPATRLMLRRFGRIEGGIRGFFIYNASSVFKPLVKVLARQNDLVYAMFANTITITGIESTPAPNNAIPDRITATLDCRLLPGESRVRFLKALRPMLVDSSLQVVVLQSPTPALYSKPNRFYRHIARALQETDKKAVVLPILFPASSDNSYFRERGTPTYGFRPTFLDASLLECVHTFNERIPVSAVDLGVSFYTLFLHNIMRDKLLLKKFADGDEEE